jgi:hypothetical protein
MASSLNEKKRKKSQGDRCKQGAHVGSPLKSEEEEEERAGST